MDGIKAAVNACMGRHGSREKIKALHRVDARQKKSPVISDRVERFLFAGLEECTKKPERKENT